MIRYERKAEWSA